MFVISLPKTAKVGDTVDVKINAKPEKVTWRDALTLVIEPNDVRNVVMVEKHSGHTRIVTA